MWLYLSVFIFAFVNSVDTTITGCPNTWIAFEGYCYLFGTGNTTFIEAEEMCRHHNAHLVEIHSNYENAFLKEETRRLGPQCAWIGVKDDIEGVWQWESDGSQVRFSDFYPGQGHPGHDAQDCGIFWKNYNYRWADHWCDRHCIPLCKQTGTTFAHVVGR